MPNFALIHGGVVTNIIVADDPKWVTDHVVAPGGYDRAVDVAELGGPIQIGWLYVRGVGYVPPEELTAAPVEIPPDGVTASTVTYVDHRPDPPASVAATVNGLEQTVQLSGGRGQLQVASKTAGDHITVEVGSVAVAVSVSS